MNLDERIQIPVVSLNVIGIPKTPVTNIFGIPDISYEIVETDEPYLLWEDGSPILWEDGSKILLEQQTKKIWRRKAKR